MKNKSILIGFLGVIVICAITTGCIFYNLLDSKEFKSHFEDLGYSITTNEEPKYTADTSYVATKDGSNYDIEYYEFDTEVNAKKAYQNYKENISDYITSKAENTETTGAVFSKIITVSDNEYIIISRVKNTLIFIAGTNDVKEEIDDLLTEIKY